MSYFVFYMQAVADQLPQLGKRELICLLSFTCNYVVSVLRGFLFLCVLGMGFIISSPEPLGSQGELIVYQMSRRPSVGFHPPFSKIFSSKTTWPIKAKFYVEPPWEGGIKVCKNVLGHMTHDQDGLHAHIW